MVLTMNSRITAVVMVPYRIIDVFISRDNMTPEEATEYFDYNVERTLPYMTDGVPPILMNKIPV